MTKHHLAWVIGIPIFLLIFGVWLWNVQFVFHRSNLGSLVGTVRESAQDAEATYRELQESFDTQLERFNEVFEARAAQAAAIELLKEKIEAGINTNANTP